VAVFHTKCPRLLLARPGTRVDVELPDEGTAIGIASEWGDRALLELFIPRSSDEAMSEAMLVACTCDRPDNLSALIEGGARPVRQLDGRTLLHVAAYRGLAQVTDILMQRFPYMANVIDNSGESPRDVAEYRGHAAIVDRLSRRALDFDTRPAPLLV
jgi:hypothetical protein